MSLLSKNLRLEFEALLSQILFGHGFLHYGFWPDKSIDRFCFNRLAEAQQEYFSQLLNTIPEETNTILDVGSGTGGNAHALQKLGYSVDCVCPSSKLNNISKQKLVLETPIFECEFEKLDIDKIYDLLLFAESFHYLNPRKALMQINVYTKHHVLIFDYFLQKEGETNTGKISHHQFVKLLSDVLQDKFQIVSDVNVTDYILPTFQMIDKLSNEYIKPFMRQCVSDFKKSRSVLSRLILPFLKEEIKNLYKGSNRHQKFADTFEYRKILLTRCLGISSAPRSAYPLTAERAVGKVQT